MTYSQILTKARKANIDAISLMVAIEVEFQLDNYVNKNMISAKNSAEIFEETCTLVENCYLKSERYSIENLALATCMLIVESNIDVAELTKYEIYDKVCEI